MKKTRSFTLGRRKFLQATALALGGAAFAFGRASASAERRYKIGIIGSGRIGGTLGNIWAQAGHTVMFSSLDIEHDRALAAKVGANAQAGSSREAAAWGEVLLLAVPYGALPQLGRDLAASIKGKVVIDACNPFPNRDGEIANWARDKGAGLASAELLPGARLVRAFNAIGAARLPEFAKSTGARVAMPLASDDAEAAKIASELVRTVGLEPVLIGGLALGRYLLPGTPLAGEHSVDEVKQAVAGLK